MVSAYVRACVAALALAACGAGCSSDPATEPATSQQPATAAGARADARPGKVPILEGYKYYVGGPSLVKDSYGWNRIAKFLGEVEQPPARGMVIGVKTDGDRLEYRVYINGQHVATHRGVMRDGAFWREWVETYRGDKPTARETTVNDDAAQVMRVKLEDIDPLTGEVIRVRETTKPYKAPVMADDDDEEEEDTPDKAAQAPPDKAEPAAAAKPAPPTNVPAEPAAPATK